jgi:hypothetical protein
MSYRALVIVSLVALAGVAVVKLSCGGARKKRARSLSCSTARTPPQTFVLCQPDGNNVLKGHKYVKVTNVQSASNNSICPGQELTWVALDGDKHPQLPIVVEEEIFYDDTVTHDDIEKLEGQTLWNPAHYGCTAQVTK